MICFILSSIQKPSESARGGDVALRAGSGPKTRAGVADAWLEQRSGDLDELNAAQRGCCVVPATVKMVESEQARRARRSSGSSDTGTDPSDRVRLDRL